MVVPSKESKTSGIAGIDAEGGRRPTAVPAPATAAPDLVTDRIGRDGKQVYIVDLFSSNGPLPGNLMEVMARRDEIVYAERVLARPRRARVLRLPGFRLG
jgi:hypothetical protein